MREARAIAEARVKQLGETVRREQQAGTLRSARPSCGSKRCNGRIASRPSTLRGDRSRALNLPKVDQRPTGTRATQSAGGATYARASLCPNSRRTHRPVRASDQMHHAHRLALLRVLRRHRTTGAEAEAARHHQTPLGHDVIQTSPTMTAHTRTPHANSSAL